MTTVQGLPDLREALLSIPSKLRKRALRNALAAGARVVQAEARRQVPVLSVASSRQAPHRLPGTVRKAISVRTSKRSRVAGNVGVFVNVKPAQRWARGAKSPRDPFYWRFLEFGTAKMRAVPFLRPAAARIGDALQVFLARIGPQIARLNRGRQEQL